MADVIQVYKLSGTAKSAGPAVATYSGVLRIDYTTNKVSGHFEYASTNISHNFKSLRLFKDVDSYDVLSRTNDGQVLSIRIANIDTQSSSADFEVIIFDREQTFISDQSIVCFCAGTRISAANGEVAVEKLTKGFSIKSATGQLRSIRWLGHRTIDCRRHPRPREVMPVRIAAHVFGQGRPARDLFVSPGHAICVDVCGEVLIPAGALVNGSTITQEDVETVTYWHVELDNHEVILAENLPCESYLEMGNRGFFAEAEAVALHARPDAPIATHADFCRPFVADGPLLEAVRTRLAARAVKDDGDRRKANAA